MNRQGLVPVTFIGGSIGPWHVDRIVGITGEPLPRVERLNIVPGMIPDAEVWSLQGTAGHTRYVLRREKDPLDAHSPLLDRPEARRAVLIPIRKSKEWWAMPQDERRAIFEEKSRHIADSMQYLPRIARRLYHARDLGQAFDFLTWFEFAPEHESAFDELLGMLRSREEWTFVDHEVEVRVSH